MKYIFENETALNLYYTITKEMGINVIPKDFKDDVYLSEEFLMICLKDIYRLKNTKK